MNRAWKLIQRQLKTCLFFHDRNNTVKICALIGWHKKTYEQKTLFIGQSVYLRGKLNRLCQLENADVIGLAPGVIVRMTDDVANSDVDPNAICQSNGHSTLSIPWLLIFHPICFANLQTLNPFLHIFFVQFDMARLLSVASYCLPLPVKIVIYDDVNMTSFNDIMNTLLW
jgi:hypothetical protein